MATNDEPPVWGTVQEAADAYRLSPDTVRRMITRGEIEARRFGPRLIRVNLGSIATAGQPVELVGGDAK